MESLIERFAEYALAFEAVLSSDDWPSLTRFFTGDASHRVAGGGPQERDLVGRAAVLAGLRRGVEALDRRFDRRLPAVLDGPDERDGAVRMTWRLTLQRDGLPDCVLEGEHAAFYRGDSIERIEERISPEATAALERYLAEHGARLRPTASGAPARPISRERMRELVEVYAQAKSRADVAGALAVCNDGFTLETVSFGLVARGKAEAELQLGAFFHAFPDYAATVDDVAFGEGLVGCWGRVEMTMRGDILGIPATGRRVSLPFFSAFGFAGDLLASERFFFDLASLCAGIGVPIDTLLEALAPLREGAGRLVASPGAAPAEAPLASTAQL